MGFQYKTEIVFDNIGRVAAAAAAAAGLAVAKAAHDIEARAKNAAPVDTGFLKSSIRADQEGPFTWRVDVQAEYGGYVEFGTSRMAARPYFTPAVEFVRPSFIQAMSGIIKGG